MKLSARLAAIAELLAPCTPSGGHCWHGRSPVEWPCHTTRAAWLAHGLDPTAAEASARSAARTPGDT